MTLSDSAFRELPLHDARFVSLSVTRAGGNLEARMAVEINPEEDISALRAYGVRQPNVRLVFLECWIVSSEILGTSSTAETVSNWFVDLDGAILLSLQARGFAKNSRVLQYTITTSSGSRIHIVAEAVACIEQPIERFPESPL